MLVTDNQKRVRLPDAKPGQVFAYETDPTGTVITLRPLKKGEPEVEVLDFDDLNPCTLAPKERGEVSNASIREAVKAGRR
jgi:hypothetical protein